MASTAPLTQVGEAITAFLERHVERMLRSPGARPAAAQAAGAAGTSGRGAMLPLLRLKVRIRALAARRLRKAGQSCGRGWVDDGRVRPWTDVALLRLGARMHVGHL